MMNLPEPEWFTIGALAQRWGKDEDYIEQLIEDGKIQAKVKEGSGRFSSDPNEMREWERANHLVPRPWSPPLQGWCIGSKIIIPLSEVERIEAPPPARDRHVITERQRGKKSKSAIRVAIENYLDGDPDGNKAGFYAFLKGKLKLTIEEPLKDGQSYNFYFNRVVARGQEEGVYLTEVKEGRKPGTPGANQYIGPYIASEISKEKKRRKDIFSKK